MAKKHAWLKWVIFSVVLIPLLWLICALITSIPVYPAFQKQVDSYAELQQCLKDIPEVVLPDPSMLELTDQVYVLNWMTEIFFPSQTVMNIAALCFTKVQK